ncbi:ABC transporter ATP-binding protein [Nocardioides alcanivorans]|uniref:ABC transporter ATP-binding protein n=1 Tax=Nocardioides alcanivorans TaxID=2897352 RepID=UPI001F3E5B2E|nr:ABC transporter ATP-binding protein [Nocardioides alcanivorans]
MSATHPAVEIRDLHVTIDRSTILEDVSLEVPSGLVVGLLGPNGCGKSTLLRATYGALRPRHGVVRTAGLDVATTRPRDLARRCAVLSQDHATDLQLRVIDVVLLGRIPHPRRRDGGSDIAFAEHCLGRVNATAMAERDFATLSGGERQRVLLARALCQEPEVLLLDEPTNHLDVAHQLDLLELVRALGISTLVALHDLTLAAAYCDRIVLLKKGRLVAQGTPEEVLTNARVEQVYGVACDVLTHPLTSRPLITVAPRRTAGPEAPPTIHSTSSDVN